jgi:hypothetical protein
MSMKRLCKVGNSLAIIIERPILRTLGIGNRALLRVSTDGERIIIEPTGKLVPEHEMKRRRGWRRSNEPSALVPPTYLQDTSLDAYALRKGALEMRRELVETYGMTDEQTKQLHHSYPRFFAAFCERALYYEMSERELRTLARLQYCLTRLRAGDAWSAAIDAAVAKYPHTPIVDPP